MSQVFVITVQNRERVKIEGGFTTRPLPDTQESIEVSIDAEAIARVFGPRAVKSKGGKAVEAGGLVVVKHLRR